MTWCAERAIALRHIQPGKPDQNASIERYNRDYRTEVLNAYVVVALDQVREISAEWCVTTNNGPMTPWQVSHPPRIGLDLKPEVLQ